MARMADLMICDICGSLNKLLPIQCWKCGYLFSQADYLLNPGTRAYTGEELKRRVREFEAHNEPVVDFDSYID